MSSARDLSARLAELLRRERAALAEFLVQARTWVTFWKAVSAALRPDEAAPHRDVVTALRVSAVAPALDLQVRAEAVSGVVTDVPGSDPLVHPDEPPRANSNTEAAPRRGPWIEAEPRAGAEDHVVPRGQGGPSTTENTRCLCKVHNQLAARQVYGDEWMDRFTRRGAAPKPSEAEAAAAPP